MILKITFLVILLLISCVISYQDFKHRLISVWALCLYFFICIGFVLNSAGIYSLLSNSLGAIVYFSFTFLVLYLFYFIRERKVTSIIDSKIGWGDIILFLAIGLTLDTIDLIVFFTISFTIAAIISLFMLRKKLSVPLAGILVWCHFCYLVILPDLL